MRKWLKKLGMFLVPCIVLQGMAITAGFTVAAGYAHDAWTATAIITGSGSTTQQAYDSSQSTRWTTGRNVAPGDWYQLDMGVAQPVNKIFMLCAAGGSTGGSSYPTVITVQLSMDAQSWTTVVSQPGAWTNTFYFSAVTARYIKFVAGGYGKNNFWSIFDLGVANATDTASPSVPTVTTKGYNSSVVVKCSASDDNAVAGYDIYRAGSKVGSTSTGSYADTTAAAGQQYSYTAKAYDYSGHYSVFSAAASGQMDSTVPTLPRESWTVTASDAYSSNSSTDEPPFAMDGSDTTRWGSGVAQYAGMWFQVNLGGTFSFDRITMTAQSAGGCPGSCNVYVSADGTNWSQVPSVQKTAPALNAGNLYAVTAQFPTQTAKYVKLQLTAAASGWWLISELNIYNDPARSFTTTLGESDTLNATVQNPVTGNSYQMWVYQKLPADVTGQATDQYIWVPMTAGANNSFSLSGATADANGNYRVSMIETDASGNVVTKSFDSPASLPTNAVRIEKILVGGKVTNGRETVNLNDATQNAPSIQIVADDATGYTLTYGTADNQTSVQAGSSKDTFPVSFANLGIGTYTFTVTATNDAGQKDVRTFTVTTYSTAGSGHTTPVISGMTGGFTGSTLGLTLTGADTQGNALKDGDGFLYRFRAGEPGRGISYSASSVSGPTGSVFVPVGKYGTYQVYATAAYGSNVAYDDAAMGYYDYTRPGGAVTVSSYTVKENGGADSSVIDQTGTTGKTYSFNATADVSKLTGGETARYSFWRCDASGWVLLKDWSPDATLSWTPAYAGKYIIQVRVQGSKAGSYESARSMTFDVASSTGLVTAKNVSLTLTATGNKARQPVTLTTAATPSAGLLYRYEVQDPTLGLTLLNAYSPDNTFTWVPRKAGNYTVYVQVINQNSFGMYDAQTSQPVTVN